MCGVPDEKVPGHLQEQLTQTLIVRLLKTRLFTTTGVNILPFNPIIIGESFLKTSCWEEFPYTVCTYSQFIQSFFEIFLVTSEEIQQETLPKKLQT